MNRQQEQANLDINTQQVLDYWQSEYGYLPDIWELAQELGVSEEVAKKQLERQAREEE